MTEPHLLVLPVGESNGWHGKTLGRHRSPVNGPRKLPGMHGQPDGVGGGLLYAMFYVSGDQEGISPVQGHYASVGELEGGGALEQEDPLILRLVVPEVFGTGLAVGNDSFHSDVVGLHQG